jgi:hypothetical protein
MGDNDKAHEEFLAQWKVAVEDLREAKRQQWLITFYGLLLQGGIITLLNIITSKQKLILTENEKWAFSILSILICSICSYFIFRFQNVKRTSRLTTIKMQEHFTDDFQNVIKEYYKYNKNKYVSFSYDVHIIIPLIFGLFIGMAIVIWYLFNLQ